MRQTYSWHEFRDIDAYEAAIARAVQIIDAPEGTPEYAELVRLADLINDAELVRLADLINDYENLHYPIERATPEEMDELFGRTSEETRPVMAKSSKAA